MLWRKEANLLALAPIHLNAPFGARLTARGVSTDKKYPGAMPYGARFDQNFNLEVGRLRHGALTLVSSLSKRLPASCLNAPYGAQCFTALVVLQNISKPARS